MASIVWATQVDAKTCCHYKVNGETLSPSEITKQKSSTRVICNSSENQTILGKCNNLAGWYDLEDLKKNYVNPSKSLCRES